VAYFRPEAPRMAVTTVTLLLNSVFDAAVPILVARGLDGVTVHPSWPSLLLLCGGVILLQGLAWVFNYIRQINSARAMSNVVITLMQDAFRAVTRHDLSFYDEQPSGKIVSRILSDGQDFAATVELTMNLLSQIIVVAFITIVLLRINVGLSLLLLGMTPLVALIALSFRHLARRVTQQGRRMLAQVNANIQESVSGIAVGKGFRQEARMYEEFAALNRQSFRVNLVRGLTLHTIFPALNATQGVVLAVLMYLGGAKALESVLAGAGIVTPGALSVGDWFLFVQAMNYFWFPIIGIASFWSQFQDSLAAAERVFALMDAAPRVVQRAALPVPPLTGQIEFRQVRLSYTGAEVVLPAFSLAIRPGERVALVGHTGSGKTSVARLVARFYEFQGGELLVDGQDIRTYDLAQYRRQLGLVPQVPFLFSGTVLDNIRYGQPQASEAEVIAAARAVAGGDWLDDLPEGLQTDVGERGARLSLGQRQLVALARVLLHAPAILILDEATASVDPFTETQIQEGLEAVMRQRTSLVIAHRLSTVRHADRIIVMRQGQIIEEGNHEALLRQGGHYAELYDTYFRHQSLSYVENARNLLGGEK
jgi:ABC-type multidrug transport system fused ATPase/permease subunit